MELSEKIHFSSQFLKNRFFFSVCRLIFSHRFFISSTAKISQFITLYYWYCIFLFSFLFFFGSFLFMIIFLFVWISILSKCDNNTHWKSLSEALFCSDECSSKAATGHFYLINALVYPCFSTPVSFLRTFLFFNPALLLFSIHSSLSCVFLAVW